MTPKEQTAFLQGMVAAMEIVARYDEATIYEEIARHGGVDDLWIAADQYDRDSHLRLRFKWAGWYPWRRKKVIAALATVSR